MNLADMAITYGANGIRCGCGKPAHSNLAACAISDEELAALASLLADPSVTAGPWGADSHEIHQTSGDIHIKWVGETCDVDAADRGAANAALIAAACNALPGLLAEIQRLRTTLAAVSAKAAEFPVLDDESAVRDYDLGRHDLAESIRHLISQHRARRAAVTN